MTRLQFEWSVLRSELIFKLSDSEWCTALLAVARLLGWNRKRQGLLVDVARSDEMAGRECGLFLHATTLAGCISFLLIDKLVVMDASTFGPVRWNEEISGSWCCFLIHGFRAWTGIDHKLAISRSAQFFRPNEDMRRAWLNLCLIATTGRSPYFQLFQEYQMPQPSGSFSSITWQAAAPAGHFAAGLVAYNNARYGTAIRAWKPLAELGHVDAQYNLGVMYGNGLGVLQDHQEAARLFRLAADQGDASAQFNLAIRYDHGLGVPQDNKAAVSLYHLAANQGDAKAQYNLGAMYEDGHGVRQDEKEATKWYRLAADQGHAGAQSKINEHAAIDFWRERSRWNCIAIIPADSKNLSVVSSAKANIFGKVPIDWSPVSAFTGVTVILCGLQSGNQRFAPGSSRQQLGDDFDRFLLLLRCRFRQCLLQRVRWLAGWIFGGIAHVSWSLSSQIAVNLIKFLEFDEAGWSQSSIFFTGKIDSMLLSVVEPFIHAVNGNSNHVVTFISKYIH
jgi:TPR repeat protein